MLSATEEGRLGMEASLNKTDKDKSDGGGVEDVITLRVKSPSHPNVDDLEFTCPPAHTIHQIKAIIQGLSSHHPVSNLQVDN